MEIVHASRKNGSYLDDLKFEFDVGISFPFPWFHGLPYVMTQNSELSTHVTTKVVQYPTVLRGVKTYADGDYEYRENAAFNPSTGNVALVRTWDAHHGFTLDQSPLGHNGAYLSYSFPAQSIHPEFGAVSGNERAYIESTSEFTIEKRVDVSDGPWLDFPGGSETTWLRKLTPGDLIELTLTTGSDAGRYHVSTIRGTKVLLQESNNYNDAVDPSLSETGAVHVRVIRSGRANLPGASLGGVATYGTPDAAVGTGVNFGWSGAGASARLALIAQLNDSLANGENPVPSVPIDTTLEFVRVSDGQCGTLGDLGLTISLRSSGDTVFVESGVYVDTIVTLGDGGWFELNDAGQIQFRSVNNLTSIQRNLTGPGPAQPVLNLATCGDSTVYRTVENVIAASASVLSDTVEYTTYGGEGWTSGFLNEFERGERGRFSTRTGYSYRTGVTASSQPSTGGRIYASGGVFDEFSLFNWLRPQDSDFSRWRRVDSITHLSADNVPIETVDRLGRASTARFRVYRDGVRLLEQTAWNAEKGTVYFESFDSYTVTGFEAGELCDTVSHSGSHSMRLGASTTPIYYPDLTVNDHLLDKGLLMRFWMRGENAADVRLVVEVSSGEIQPDSIARAGEWTLLEVSVPTDTLQYYFTSGDLLKLNFKNVGTDEIFIDDIKAQPTDAASSASVFDRETFAIVASFDDGNFGAYPVYDGEGRASRTIVETARGRRTIMDAHANVVGTVRDWNGEGSPWGTSTLFIGGGASQSVGVSLGDDGNGVDVNVADIHIGVDRQAVSVFGVSPSELRDAILREGETVEDLTQPHRRLLSEYQTLFDQRRDLVEQLQEAATPEEKERIRKQIDAVARRQEQVQMELQTDR